MSTKHDIKLPWCLWFAEKSHDMFYLFLLFKLKNDWASFNTAQVNVWRSKISIVSNRLINFHSQYLNWRSFENSLFGAV